MKNLLKSLTIYYNQNNNSFYGLLSYLNTPLPPLRSCFSEGNSRGGRVFYIIFVLVYCIIIFYACNFSVYKIAALLTSFLFSFAISNFFLDRFKYSNNVYIKFIQKLIFRIILTILVFMSLFYSCGGTYILGSPPQG